MYSWKMIVLFSLLILGFAANDYEAHQERMAKITAGCK